MHKILETLRDAQKALKSLLGSRPADVEGVAYDPDESKLVDLVVSGYEWLCLNCHEENSEIEATENVTCRKCGKGFETYLPQYTYE